MSMERMLKAHDLFQSLTPDEVDRVNRFSTVRKCQGGDVVFRARDTATHLFIVLEGLVHVLVPSTPSEIGLVMARAEQGDLFGLSPLLGSPTYTLSAQCARPTEILAVEAKPLRELLLANPVVGFDVMTSVSRTYFTRYVELTRRLQGIVAQLPLMP
jgi:thioredoxin reductase (NADPH)